jgi:anti-anti-sigma factor
MVVHEGARSAAASLGVGAEVLPDGVHVLHVAGEIDALTKGAFAEALHDAVSRSAGLLVVDLARVTFLSASGIGALATEFHRAAGCGVELRLAGPRRTARRALEITGLLDLVPCHATLVQALTPIG